MLQLINNIYITIWSYLHQHKTLSNNITHLSKSRQSWSICFCNVISFLEDVFSKSSVFSPPLSSLLLLSPLLIPFLNFWNLSNSTLSQMTPICLHTCFFHSSVFLIPTVLWKLTGHIGDMNVWVYGTPFCTKFVFPLIQI